MEICSTCVRSPFLRFRATTTTRGSPDHLTDGNVATTSRRSLFSFHISGSCKCLPQHEQGQP
eukprot:13109615-Heterocapsa_arctica.AAC.1